METPVGWLEAGGGPNRLSPGCVYRTPQWEIWGCPGDVILKVTPGWSGRGPGPKDSCLGLSSVQELPGGNEGMGKGAVGESEELSGDLCESHHQGGCGAPHLQRTRGERLGAEIRV